MTNYRLSLCIYQQTRIFISVAYFFAFDIDDDYDYDDDADMPNY